MGKKELAADIEQQKYFKPIEVSTPDSDEGTREMGELYPFVISGGENTERYYFMHINDITEYKFNLRPEYFCDESNYTESFPKRINEILESNNDAKIFCVFDWDTIYSNKTRQEKHKAFKRNFKDEISEGTVSLCPSMPSIEYWFLLHFINHTDLLKNYSKLSQVLSKYIKNCFANPSIHLKKLLKKEEHLKDPTWVKNLCKDGKLELAIERAEENIKKAIESNCLDKQSYSYVYKIFKTIKDSNLN